MPAEVKKLQDAITAGGGTVLATVDNTADADLRGITIPPNTVVIGGPPAAGLPMLRINQQAAAALPARYLVTAGRHAARSGSSTTDRTTSRSSPAPSTPR